MPQTDLLMHLQRSSAIFIRKHY